MREPNFAAADDDQILRGVPQIAAAINTTERRAYWMLERGVFDGVVWKELGIWTSTLGRLRQHYHRQKHPKQLGATQVEDDGRPNDAV